MTIRVLHVSVWAKTFTRFRMPLLEAQRAQQFSVAIACLNERPFSDELRQRGFQVHSLPISGSYGYSQLTANARSIIWLARLIRQESYQIVHTHQPIGSILGLMASRLTRPPLLIHTTGGLKAQENSPRFLDTVYGIGERRLLRWADAILSVNRTDVGLMTDKWELPTSKVFYVGPCGGCGIDTRLFRQSQDIHKVTDELRREIGVPDHHKVVGIVSRLVWEKGYRELLSAAQALVRAHTNLTFLVVGEGPHGKQIRALARDLGIADRVVFAGTRADVPHLLQVMDVFALPSHREAFGVSAAEAMAAGVPVVASKARGLTELIIDGESGLLVPVKDVKALYRSIDRLLNDKGLARRLGQQGQSRVENEFSRDTLLPRQLEIYQEIIQSRISHTAKSWTGK